MKSSGGTVQYGWLIWERQAGILCEAEFHAVWLNSDGTYIDVTPQAPAITQILFLPDGVRKYEGRPVYNRVWPLCKNNKALDEYIKLVHERDAECDKGVFIHGTSLASYSPYVAERIEQLEAKLAKLISELNGGGETGS